jgi:peptide-methionine (S)-S-oxide reductase
MHRGSTLLRSGRDDTCGADSGKDLPHIPKQHLRRTASACIYNPVPANPIRRPFGDRNTPDRNEWPSNQYLPRMVFRPSSWFSATGLILTVLLTACSEPPAVRTPASTPTAPTPAQPTANATTTTPPHTPQTPVAMATPDSTPPAPNVPTELATFGSGCFWCSEAVLERLDGVLDVVSGYCGGAVDRPTYEQVCTGTTGHAEVVQVTFDPKRITYEHLLEYFFKLHDPTTLNRQGPDEGTQYRSAIFYHSEQQKQVAEQTIAKLQPKFHNGIVTEVTAAPHFWPAEDYHQDYFTKNPNNRYCRAMIPPKLQKLGLDVFKK